MIFDCFLFFVNFHKNKQYFVCLPRNENLKSVPFDNDMAVEKKDLSSYGINVSHSCNRDAENSKIRGEVALWRAVVLQQLIDLKSQSKKRRNQQTKKNAYNWLMKEDNEDDVREICDYADYDYNDVKKIARELACGNKTLVKLNLEDLQRIL